MAGFSSGTVAVYDCSYAKVKGYLSLSAVPVKALASVQSADTILVASEGGRFDLVKTHPDLKVIRSAHGATGSQGKRSNKKAKHSGGLTGLAVSTKGDFLAEVSHTGASTSRVTVHKLGLKDLSMEQVWSNENLFNQQVADISFVDGKDTPFLVVCSNSQAAVYDLKSDQPVVIFDQATKDQTLQRVVVSGTLVACLGQEEITLYQTMQGASAVLKPIMTVSSAEIGVKQAAHEALLSMRLGLSKVTKKKKEFEKV